MNYAAELIDLQDSLRILERWLGECEGFPKQAPLAERWAQNALASRAGSPSNSKALVNSDEPFNCQKEHWDEFFEKDVICMAAGFGKNDMPLESLRTALPGLTRVTKGITSEGFKITSQILTDYLTIKSRLDRSAEFIAAGADEFENTLFYELLCNPSTKRICALSTTVSNLLLYLESIATRRRFVNHETLLLFQRGFGCICEYVRQKHSRLLPKRRILIYQRLRALKQALPLPENNLAYAVPVLDEADYSYANNERIISLWRDDLIKHDNDDDVLISFAEQRYDPAAETPGSLFHLTPTPFVRTRLSLGGSESPLHPSYKRHLSRRTSRDGDRPMTLGEAKTGNPATPQHPSITLDSSAAVLSGEPVDGTFVIKSMSTVGDPSEESCNVTELPVGRNNVSVQITNNTELGTARECAGPEDATVNCLAIGNSGGDSEPFAEAAEQIDLHELLTVEETLWPLPREGNKQNHLQKRKNLLRPPRPPSSSRPQVPEEAESEDLTSFILHALQRMKFAAQRTQRILKRDNAALERTGIDDCLERTEKASTVAKTLLWSGSFTFLQEMLMLAVGVGLLLFTISIITSTVLVA